MKQDSIEHAVKALSEADALLVTAGAGMGVDSGLPDFRGPEGFWRAYPALQRAGLGFRDVASPKAFREHPELAWGFYGNRLALYRSTVPHEGFRILLRWAQRMAKGAYVFTSNVDGQFQKSGFSESRVVECHGSIHFLQCLDNCAGETWGGDYLNPTIDESNCCWLGELPICPHCGALARPNILMFEDGEWVSGWYDRQREAMEGWRRGAGKVAVVEVGAGTAIPTIRNYGEKVGRPLIRINTAAVGACHAETICLQLAALEALSLLDEIRRQAEGD